MFVRVPVAYHAEIVRKGCRKSETPLFGEWVDVHVVELADPEAPVATRRATDRTGDHPGGFIETRWFDGSHWSPVAYTAAGQPAEHIDAERLLAACADGAGYANPLMSGHDWQARDFVRGRTGPLADVAVRNVYSSGRDAAIEQAQANAENVVIVDGLAWQRVSEPVYHVDKRTFGFEDHVSIDVVSVDTLDHKGSSGAFAANRWDDAVEYARSLGVERTRIDETARMDVFVPDSIRFDDERPALIAGMKNILSWGAPDPDDATRDEMLAWMDFRDAYRAAVADASDGNCDALVEAAERNAAVNFRGDGWQQGRLAPVIERWRVRPLAIGFDDTPRIAR